MLWFLTFINCALRPKIRITLQDVLLATGVHQLEEIYSVRKYEVSFIINLVWFGGTRLLFQNSKTEENLRILYLLCSGKIAQIPQVAFW
jgi:hypothetical protein